MCGLQIFAGPPIYHLLGNIISVTVGLVYINVQSKYDLPSSTRFGQFQKFEKFELEHCPPHKATVSAWGMSSCS